MWALFLIGSTYLLVDVCIEMTDLDLRSLVDPIVIPSMAYYMYIARRSHRNRGCFLQHSLNKAKPLFYFRPGDDGGNMVSSRGFFLPACNPKRYLGKTNRYFKLCKRLLSSAFSLRCCRGWRSFLSPVISSTFIIVTHPSFWRTIAEHSIFNSWSKNSWSQSRMSARLVRVDANIFF